MQTTNENSQKDLVEAKLEWNTPELKQESAKATESGAAGGPDTLLLS